MRLDAQELHRRITRMVGAGRLAEIFRVSKKMIYAWSGRSPQLRGYPPIEKFRMIMKELAKAGDIDLAGLVAAYALQDVPGIIVVKLCKEGIEGGDA